MWYRLTPFQKIYISTELVFISLGLFVDSVWLILALGVFVMVVFATGKVSDPESES